MFDPSKWRVLGLVLAAGIAFVALIHYWGSLPAWVQDMVTRAIPEPNPFFGAVWSWVRGASSAAPDEKPGRLRLCVNADVPAYGNMQDRADKGLQWLREHKKEYVGAIAALGEEGEELKRAVDSADLDNPKFLEGFRWTFGVGHTAGCLEYEKQLAIQAASASDDALFDSCINSNLAMQIMAAVKELPDFEIHRQNVGDPAFFLGVQLGTQRGHVDGCILADALKRSDH